MIKATDVSVVSGDITLLPQTSVKVPSARALMVRGPNGAGKSTLLRVLGGKIQPATGSVAVADHPACERNPEFRRIVSTMIGLPPMAPDLTVHDHVLLVATTWVSSRQEAALTTHRVLDDLGISALRSRFPHELSSGQTQLFGLALVLARPFKVLILDEPEQRLDPDRVSLVTKALRSRRDAGATLIVATHNATMANELGDCDLELDSRK